MPFRVEHAKKSVSSSRRQNEMLRPFSATYGGPVYGAATLRKLLIIISFAGAAPSRTLLKMWFCAPPGRLRRRLDNFQGQAD